MKQGKHLQVYKIIMIPAVKGEPQSGMKCSHKGLYKLVRNILLLQPQCNYSNCDKYGVGFKEGVRALYMNAVYGLTCSNHDPQN